MPTPTSISGMALMAVSARLSQLPRAPTIMAQ